MGGSGGAGWVWIAVAVVLVLVLAGLVAVRRRGAGGAPPTAGPTDEASTPATGEAVLGGSTAASKPEPQREPQREPEPQPEPELRPAAPAAAVPEPSSRVEELAQEADVEPPPDPHVGAGSAPADPGAPPPPGFPLKGNVASMLFHSPDSPYFARTRADVWFNTEEAAREAGFTRWDQA